VTQAFASNDLNAPAFDVLRDAFSGVIDRIDGILDEEAGSDPFQRDPELIASLWGPLKAIQLYLGSEIRGWENVPKGEPVLIVGNHSGGAQTIDMAPVLLRWIESRGCEAPLYGLAYDLLFASPGMGPLLRRAGFLPANRHNARRALDKGAAVMVFPGGDYEVFRPWRDRNKIQFGGRMGFIEQAIEAGVRVVPMTIHGAHESTFVMSRGHDLAKRLGLDRLRVKVFPVQWNIPFGPAPAFIPSIPLPSKLTIQMGDPIDWSHHAPEAADDPDVLHACYDEITGAMQRTLDALAAERPYPILTRLDELRPSQVLKRTYRRFRA
jgi:1-acyl-sn-glycerol-3-phosphate acyltransferase